VKDEQLVALTQLKGTSWYQGKDLVKDYIDQFSELMDVVEYLDDKAIVIKFCKGLDPNIQNMVATLGECPPKIDEPERWFKAVQKVSQNWDANEAFLESTLPKTFPPPQPTFITVRQPLIPVHPTNPPEPSP